MPDDFLPIGPSYANKPIITKPVKIKPLDIKDPMSLASKIKIASALVVVCVILSFLYLPYTQGYKQEVKNMILENLMPVPYRPYPLNAELTVQRSLTIQNKGGVMEYSFEVPYPGNVSSSDGQNIQRVVAVNGTPAPSNGNVSTNPTILWNGSVIGSGNRQISITYQIMTTTYQWKLKASEVGDLSDIPNCTGGSENLTKYVYTNQGRTWLDNNNYWKIDPQNAAIATIAQNLTQNKTNVLEILRSLYDYMTVYGGFNYSTAAGELKSAVQTLTDKTGDCDDQSTIFVSIARAAGIPAWLELGALYDERADKWVGHGWLQVYIPLKNGGAVIAPIDVVNKEFLFRDAYRFTDFVDNGSTDGLKNYYVAFRANFTGSDAPVITEEYTTLSWQSSGNFKLMDGELADLGLGFLPAPDGSAAIMIIAIGAVVVALAKKKRWQ